MLLFLIVKINVYSLEIHIVGFWSACIIQDLHYEEVGGEVYLFFIQAEIIWVSPLTSLSLAVVTETYLCVLSSPAFLPGLQPQAYHMVIHVSQRNKT